MKKRSKTPNWVKMLLGGLAIYVVVNMAMKEGLENETKPNETKAAEPKTASTGMIIGVVLLAFVAAIITIYVLGDNLWMFY